MRILLIQPPIQDFYQTAIRTYPLGLAYLAAPLLDNGFEVIILDGHNPEMRRTIPLPSEFRYIRHYYALNNKSPYKLFNHYYHFGLTVAEIGEQIKRIKPDLVGITARFSPYSEIALDISKSAKKINANILTVLGGPHVWAMPEHILKSGSVDYIIRGEGELSFLSLCKTLRNGFPNRKEIETIPGIGFTIRNTIYLHPDFAIVNNLDELPFPARSLLDPSAYSINHKAYTMLQTSRGCPHSCGFCALSASPCGSFRLRSVKKVLEEVDLCLQQYGITHFDIEDDNFTANQNHAATFLNGIKKLDKPDISLSAMNGISAKSLTPVLLKSMITNGFSHLDLALVTNNAHRRQAVRRPGKLQQFNKIVNDADSYGLKTTVHIILGLPEDSIDNMIETILHLLPEPCFIGANIYYPVPGSPLFIRHQEHIQFPNPSFWRSTLASCEEYKGHRVDYMTILYLTRIINYIKQQLSGRYKKYKKKFSLEKFIFKHFESLVREEDRSHLNNESFASEKRWRGDILGAFMLRRFAEKQQIEKVTVNNVSNGVTYSFADEFCNGEIIKNFWNRAKEREIKGSNFQNKTGTNQDKYSATEYAAKAPSPAAITI